MTKSSQVWDSMLTFGNLFPLGKISIMEKEAKLLFKSGTNFSLIPPPSEIEIKPVCQAKEEQN